MTTTALRLRRQPKPLTSVSSAKRALANHHTGSSRTCKSGASLLMLLVLATLLFGHESDEPYSLNDPTNESNNASLVRRAAASVDDKVVVSKVPIRVGATKNTVDRQGSDTQQVTAFLPRDISSMESTSTSIPNVAAFKVDQADRMVLSYSLHRTLQRHPESMVATAQQVLDTYPGWEVRIYHDGNTVPLALTNMKHVHLIHVPTEFPAWVSRSVNPMSWRLLVASDPTVTAFGIRDGDSRPSKRERLAVDEWLASGKSFHIMRDHPMHDPSRFAAILGGMWGARGNAVPHMEQLLHDYYSSNTTTDTDSVAYVEDQDFLWSRILPLAKDDCFQHDSYYCTESGGIAFPTRREDTSEPYIFAGNALNRNLIGQTIPRDARLTKKDAVANYRKCLVLRSTMVAESGQSQIPDTSYKGRTNKSATATYAESNQGASNSILRSDNVQTVNSTVLLDGNGKANTGEQLKVLSYSLYGKKLWYTEGMVATAKQVNDTYPGWQVRVYHDESVPSSILLQLAAMSHVKLVNVPKELPEWMSRTVNPMSWRFIVASDPTVQVFGIRDGDSQPSEREKAAVDEWLQSGKAFHIMRDHPMHDPSKFATILGGMWGALGGAVPRMEELLHNYYNTTRDIKYAEDQDFLWSEILPLAKNDCFQHDSYYCTYSGGIAFPMKRDDARYPNVFVGNAFNRQPGVRIHQNRQLGKGDLSRYNKCLEFREQIMAGANHGVLPDTSYKGGTNVSSTEMWWRIAARDKNMTQGKAK